MKYTSTVKEGKDGSLKVVEQIGEVQLELSFLSLPTTEEFSVSYEGLECKLETMNMSLETAQTLVIYLVAKIDRMLDERAKNS